MSSIYLSPIQVNEAGLLLYLIIEITIRKQPMLMGKGILLRKVRIGMV